MTFYELDSTKVATSFIKRLLILFPLITTAFGAGIFATAQISANSIEIIGPTILIAIVISFFSFRYSYRQLIKNAAIYRLGISKDQLNLVQANQLPTVISKNELIGLEENTRGLIIQDSQSIACVPKILKNYGEAKERLENWQPIDLKERNFFDQYQSLMYAYLLSSFILAAFVAMLVVDSPPAKTTFGVAILVILTGCIVAVQRNELYDTNTKRNAWFGFGLTTLCLLRLFFTSLG